MSVVGLQASEKLASGINRKIRESLNLQRKELKEEIDKLQHLLGNREQMTAWRNTPANAEKAQSLFNRMSEVEKLYLQAGDSNAARLFHERTKKQLKARLTNLKANELEVKLRAEQFRLQTQQPFLTTMNEVRTEGHLREMYAQARGSGGYLSNFGRGFMQDLITFETKAAGSKTLGNYMESLYNKYEGELRNTFVNGIVRGDDYETMIRNLQQGTKLTERKAELLVVTEANAIFNESVREVIDDNPLVKGYRFRAVLDSRTSKICQEHDGDYVPKDEVIPGVNYPPLHPRCRSTVTTVLVGENEKKDTVQRYTKNGSNEWVPIPPGMKYPEFKERINSFRQTHSSNFTREGGTISQDDPRIIYRGTIRIVPNVPGSAAMLDRKLSESISIPAQKRYDEALREEKTITGTMIDLAKKQNVGLNGIEFSAKTASSVSEKIERLKMEKKTEETIQTDEEVVGAMGDLIRYTVMTQHDGIVPTTEEFVRGLEDRGYDIIALDNKYVLEEATYKGVHLEAVSRDGQKFEVQVHSDKSLEVKNKTHPIYEEWRKPETPEGRKTDLELEMIKLAATIPTPKDIDKLKSFRKEIIR